MSIFYAAVKKAGKSPETASSGAVSAEVMDLTSKLLDTVEVAVSSKKSYTTKGLTFNYITESGVCFLCVAEDVFPRRVCFSFLERIKNEFIARGSVSKSFLKAEMEFFSTNPDADKIRKVQTEVDEVKDIMMENIDRILTRGERLEDIDRKTDDLRFQSTQFSKKAKTLKCALIRENIKLTIVIILIIGLIVLLVGGIVIWQVVRATSTPPPRH